MSDMTINAPHGMVNVTSTTGISGSMQITKTTSVIFRVRPDERPNISVYLTNPTPASVEIKAKPAIFKVSAELWVLNDG
jgi:hypothetical protein